METNKLLLTQVKQTSISDIFDRIIYNFLKNVVSFTSDPFDCVSDPCHLAWLIRDNRQLLDQVPAARCSNGVAFKDLDVSQFNDCPASPNCQVKLLAIKIVV